MISSNLVKNYEGRLRVANSDVNKIWEKIAFRGFDNQNFNGFILKEEIISFFLENKTDLLFLILHDARWADTEYTWFMAKYKFMSDYAFSDARLFFGKVFLQEWDQDFVDAPIYFACVNASIHYCAEAIAQSIVEGVED